MKNTILKSAILAIALFCMPKDGYTQIKAVTETGEKVLLHENGTWEYEGNVSSGDHEISVNLNPFEKSDKADFLIKSNIVKTGFWINPKEWSFEKSADEGVTEYQLENRNEEIYGLILTEDVEVPILSLRDVAFQNAQNAAPDMKIIKEEFRKVNGLNVLLIKMEGTISGMKLTYLGYYHSTPKSTIQYLTYGISETMEAMEADCEELLNGLVELK